MKESRLVWLVWGLCVWESNWEASGGTAGDQITQPDSEIKPVQLFNSTGNPDLRRFWGIIWILVFLFFCFLLFVLKGWVSDVMFLIDSVCCTNISPVFQLIRLHTTTCVLLYNYVFLFLSRQTSFYKTTSSHTYKNNRAKVIIYSLFSSSSWWRDVFSQ